MGCFHVIKLPLNFQVPITVLLPSSVSLINGLCRTVAAGITSDAKIKNLLFGSTREICARTSGVMFKMYNNCFVSSCLHMTNTFLSQVTLVNSQVEAVSSTWQPTETSIVSRVIVSHHRFSTDVHFKCTVKMMTSQYSLKVSSFDPHAT